MMKDDQYIPGIVDGNTVTMYVQSFRHALDGAYVRGKIEGMKIATKICKKEESNVGKS